MDSWLRLHALAGPRKVFPTYGDEWWVGLECGVGIALVSSSCFLYIVDSIAHWYFCFYVSNVSSYDSMETIVRVLESGAADYGAIVAGIESITPDAIHFKLECPDVVGEKFASDGLVFFNGTNWQFFVSRDGFEAVGCILFNRDEIWTMCLVNSLRELPIGTELTERVWTSVTTMRSVRASSLLRCIRETDWADAAWSLRTMFPVRPTVMHDWEREHERRYVGEWLETTEIGDLLNDS